MRVLPILAKIAASSLILIFVLACGKKPQEASEPKIEAVKPSIPNDLEDFLEKQSVSCEPGKLCPNYIAKIVVVDFRTNKKKFCTGLLVDTDVVMTSASCLTGLMRAHNQDCSLDVHLYFPRSMNRGTERVACKRVLQSSQLVGSDPVLWRDDVSYLQVEVPSKRRHLPLSREGIPDQRKFTVWGAEQMDDHTALIRQSTCESVFGSFLNPFATSDLSPNMLFAGCPFRRGLTGGPIVDTRGRVRGIVSGAINEQLRHRIEGLNISRVPLSDMFYATNLGCSPGLNDLDLAEDIACSKDMSESLLRSLQARMLQPEVVFADLRDRLDASLRKVSRFLDFGFDLVAQETGYNVNVYPRCFKPIGDWRSEFRKPRSSHVFSAQLPRLNFRIAMDNHGRISASSEQSTPAESFFVQFNPKSAIFERRSSVWIWNEHTAVQEFADITDSCP